MAPVGRNDPCPCGSGQKYKRCCMARDKAAQAERVAWERAAHDMGVALIGFAKENDFVKDLAAGLGLFWQDRYAADTLYMMSVDESLRFFDWFAHDYGMRYCGVPQDCGTQQIRDAAVPGKRWSGTSRTWSGTSRTLIEIYRERVGDALSEKETTILDGWIESLPGSAFVLEETDSERGTIVIRDLFLAGRALTVHDKAAASHAEVGQILLARPLPEGQRVRLAGATAVLPASEEEGLRAFIEEAYRVYVSDLAEEAPNTSSSEMAETDGFGVRARFLRDRAHLLTHYALEWADRAGRPAISAQDPDARKPGTKALQKLIRWRQERVQVR